MNRAAGVLILLALAAFFYSRRSQASTAPALPWVFSPQAKTNESLTFDYQGTTPATPEEEAAPPVMVEVTGAGPTPGRDANGELINAPEDVPQLIQNPIPADLKPF